MSLSEPFVAAAGQTAGRYRILLELGEGGMAKVFVAVSFGSVGFSKLAVLKVPKLQASDAPNVQRMFMREARLSARLNHENVVAVHDVFEQGGSLVLAMEYLEGQSLSAIIRASRAGLPLETGLGVLIEALSGLHYAHELKDYDGRSVNLVHRDVSPHNLFVTYDGGVKVLDFGVAKFDLSETQSEQGVIKGKLRYMAPEQLRDSSIDRRADVFSAGVILWELITHSRLWDRAPDLQVINQLLNEPVPTPSSVAPDCDPALEEICMKALAREPTARYQSALEFQTALAAFCTTKGLSVSNRDIARVALEPFTEVREARKQRINRLLLEDDDSSLPEPTTRNTIPTPTLASSGPPTRLLAPQPRQRRLKSKAVAAVVLLGIALVALRKLGSSPPSVVPDPISSGALSAISDPAPGLPTAPLPPPVQGVASGTTPASASAPSKGTRAPPSVTRHTPAVHSRCNPPYVLDTRGVRRPKAECL